MILIHVQFLYSWCTLNGAITILRVLAMGRLKFTLTVSTFCSLFVNCVCKIDLQVCSVGGRQFTQKCVHWCFQVLRGGLTPRRPKPWRAFSHLYMFEKVTLVNEQSIHLMAYILKISVFSTSVICSVNFQPSLITETQFSMEFMHCVWVKMRLKNLPLFRAWAS